MLDQQRSGNGQGGVGAFLLAVLCVLATSLSAKQLSGAPKTNGPNIVVILADDLGYGDLGAYGATDLQTPNIDRLISQGMRLNNAYANCPVCSPTRASLLTGRYPELVGVPGVIRTHPANSWGYLNPKSVLLPELLGRHGYETAIIGKWHLGLESPNRPNQRGFQFFHGFLGDMMDDYYHHRRHNVNYMRRDEKTIAPNGHATDLFTDWAVEYLAERAAVGKKPAKPFFLYLAYNAPHTPIQPPADWLAKIRKRQPEVDDKRAKLVALIEHMDHGIGRVLTQLRDSQLAENTLVVFTSDNGGQVSVGARNGAARDGKQSMYEGGLRVPCCAVWPSKIAAGSRSQLVSLTMDLYPTICEAAGIKVKHAVDGVSILPTLRGDPQTLNRDVFFHRREGGQRYGGLTIQAVRRGPWKLLQNSPFGPLELYNLTHDPLEKTDLAVKNRGKFNELSTALRAHIQRGGAVPWQPP